MGMILGIDQGSTHTRAALCDREGNILAVGHSFGACHAYDGMERAMQAVREASEMALQAAKTNADPLELLFAGMTGADWPEEYGLLRDGLRRLEVCPAEVRVVNDAIIALRGGTSRPYGVILIAGTGGNSAVRSPAGEEFIYHYYHDPDLQGGGALGTRALNAILRAHTGRGASTLLTPLTLEHYRLGSVDELCKRYYAGQLSKVSELAPVVFEAACQGDATAAAILSAFGAGYAELAAAALRKMEMLELEVEVVLSGSIFKGKGTLLVDTIRAGILRDAPQARLVNARYEPLVGALMLGLENLGVRIERGVAANLESSAQQFDLMRLKQPTLI